jgi:hypothetical protein
MKIICHTLFDITKTGINFRRRFDTEISTDQQIQRNQQCNFETVLQVINMRCQPENISDIERSDVKISELERYNFGYLYSEQYLKKKTVTVWTFEFETDKTDVFNNGISDVGYLLQDCENVPMITGLEETVPLSRHLDVTDENRNIWFIITKQ